MNIVRKGSNETCKIKYRRDNNAYRNNENDKGVTYITFNSLENTGIVQHCFSTRLGGVSEGIFSTMNLSFTRGDDPEHVKENYRRISEVMDCDVSDIVCSQQTHTTNVKRVTKADCGNGVTRPNEFKDVDGLITNEKGVVLATFFADCVPLYIVDKENEVIGLSHSGWRGTVNKMGEVTLRKMAEEFGTKPENVNVVIGPCICQDCYEVSEDVALEFEKNFIRDDLKAFQFMIRFYSGVDLSEDRIKNALLIKKDNGKYQLNLWYANYRVFRDFGVPDENIEITDLCTCCNPDFLFSHRASEGKRGNLGAFLTLKLK